MSALDLQANGVDKGGETVKIYMVWHIHHFPEEDGFIHHSNAHNDLPVHFEHDNFKSLGAFFTVTEAEEAIARARLRPGFKDEPDCFQVNEFVVGEDQWTEGFNPDQD